jgi:hypothetical protein
VKISCDSKAMRHAKTDVDDGYEMVPPDGGWGWLVLCNIKSYFYQQNKNENTLFLHFQF